MKVSVKFIFLGTFLHFSTSILASPSPLGFELGKSRIEDVKKKYNILKLTHICENQNCYQIDNIKSTELDGLKSATFTFDNKGVLQLANLNMDKSKFEFILQSFSEKYKILGQTSDQSHRSAIFVDGNSDIAIMSLSNFEVVSINYVSKMGKKLIQQCESKLHPKQKKML